MNPRRRFALLLARTFGYVNVDKMLDEITTEQFTEWLAEYRIEPWGDERVDFGFARMITALAGGNPLDHMPFMERDGVDDQLAGVQMREAIKARALAQEV